MQPIAYQGAPGAYSEQAIQAYCQNAEDSQVARSDREQLVY